VLESPVDTKEINLQQYFDAETEGATSLRRQTDNFEKGSTPLFRYEGPDVAGDNDSDEAETEKLSDGHIDFDIRSKEYSVFHIQMFSWSDHGYSTLSRFYPEMSDLLEKEFNEIKNLTYEFMGNEKDVDTFKFRWAIWQYVMRIKGVVDDDYLYREVNTLLTKPLKSYVKTVVCYPQLVTAGLWKNFIRIQPSEKVHICMLAMEARKQAELLYGLSAVMQFMGARDE